MDYYDDRLNLLPGVLTEGWHHSERGREGAQGNAKEVGQEVAREIEHGVAPEWRGEECE